MNKNDRRKAQLIMKDILVQVTQICDKHNLSYWLDGGTLLGAVRHQGFIPWDDDIDIAMPRSDYNKFINIAKTELSSDLFLQHRSTDPSYTLPWIKIRKNGTRIIEVGETGNEEYHHGLFIDIFPCDNYRSQLLIKWMRWTRTIRDMKKNYAKGSIKRFFIVLYTNVLLIVPVKISQLVYKYLVNKHKRYNTVKSEYLSYGLECCPIYLTKTRWFYPLKKGELLFEGQRFYVPNDYHSVLSALYGKNYLTLPPVEQRVSHAKYIDIGEN